MKYMLMMNTMRARPEFLDWPKKDLAAVSRNPLERIVGVPSL